ncbi:MAG: nodulation protein NfeD [Bacteroidales bacterium]|nr:nodulation protein NfeD [Bacteroidales bacterium]
MSNTLKIFIRLLAVTFLFPAGVSPAGTPQGKENSHRVYVLEIMETIAPPVWRKTQIAFEQALDTNADLVLIHMNTYGGMLDAADSIRTIILKSPIPVWVFIDNNAASAGALISIACDSIYMYPGANIGAATVVDQAGKPLPDKYQSYMRSMMRATAEATGRDPDIAQAMVDPRISIEGITDTGQVLTFTSQEAMKYGFCEGIATSINEVLSHGGIDNYEIIKQKITGIDRIIGFLINPFVSGILIMIIIGGIYFELQTPGIGFPLGAAVVAALLYFAPLYLEGLAEHWEILLFIAGLILVAVELFVIPGFGAPGIMGIILIITGLTLSMTDNMGFDFTGIGISGLLKSFFIVIIAMFLSILLSFYFGRKLLTTNTFGHLALDSIQEKESGFIASDSRYSSTVGKEGIASTILRPAGKVRIGDEVFDATAQTGYIEKDEPVIVTGYSTSQLIVIKKPK